MPPSRSQAWTPVPATRSYSDALQQESLRVVAAVQAPLRDLVSIRLQPNNDPLDAAQPVLTLHFTNAKSSSVWRVLSRSVVDSKRIGAALDAVTLVLTHSRLLRTHTHLNASFWTQLFDSKVMASEVTEGVRTWMGTGGAQGKRSALRIVLDFEGGGRRGRLGKKWLDAIYRFMTDPQQQPEFGKQFQHREPRQFQRQHRNKSGAQQAKIFFGLSFTNSRLTAKCLVLIQRMLDAIAPGFNHHYGIDMLDLSHNAMSAEQLDIVTEILKRNHIYQIEDIRLDEIIKTPLVRKESASVQDLLAAAFDVSRLSAEPQFDPASSSSYSARATIPSISLATNPLGAQHIASVCSALRYGCAFEELSLASMIHLVDPSERELCWRWLAFGIFYPRSRRFAEKFKLRKINLLNSDITAASVEAFANALYNPVAEFRRPGQPEDNEAVDAVLVGVVERGATVYSQPIRFSRPLLTLAYQQELELLHTSQDDKWVCVVVAGVGLGWLQAEQVLRVEGDFERNTTITDAAHFDLVISDASRARVTTPETHTFIETVGKHLRSLAVKDSGSLSIQNIVYHCKNLQHLDLEGCNLQGESFSDLLGCLNGHFGRRIASLNLNRTFLSDDDITNLAKLLSNPRKLRKLTELRLFKVRISHVGLESLRSALRKNKTLATLELEEPGDDFYEEWSRAERDRIDAMCQNEKLDSVPLSLDRKLAFLSAVVGASSAVEAAGAMNLRAFELIFRFAEEPARRKIVWTKPKPVVIE